jgi:prepilin-type N-terminal cleavage/methylation domain-containing protein
MKLFMIKNNHYGGNMKRKFTLIELLVTIAIIAILASILLPALGKVRAKAKASICANNMKQVSLGFQFYQNDWNGYFPRYRRSGNASYSWMQTLSTELAYLPNFKDSNGPLWNSIWFCPESVKGSEHYRSLTTNNNLYNYYMSYAYPYSATSSQLLRGLGGKDDLAPAKITQIRSPSCTMSLIEVLAEKTVDTDTFYIPSTIIDVNANPVFGWHGGYAKGTNLLSVDGHTEYFSNGYLLGNKFSDRGYWQREKPFNTDWN